MKIDAFLKIFAILANVDFKLKKLSPIVSPTAAVQPIGPIDSKRNQWAIQ